MKIGLIKRNFKTRRTDIMIKLYKQYVRPNLEYCTPIWSPSSKGDIEHIEKVQKRFLRLIPSLHGLNYDDKLKQCNLKTLACRRKNFDLLLAHNIIKQGLNLDVKEFFSFSREKPGIETRSHTKDCLLKPSFRTNFRKHFFAARVVDPWNSLPVDNREKSYLSFKNSL